MDLIWTSEGIVARSVGVVYRLGHDKGDGRKCHCVGICYSYRVEEMGGTKGQTLLLDKAIVKVCFKSDCVLAAGGIVETNSGQSVGKKMKRGAIGLAMVNRVLHK